MRHRSLAFTFVELLVVIAIASLLIALLLSGIEAAYTAAHDRRTKATLKFERRSSWSGGLCSMEVFVNGLKLGTVDNGCTKDFKFVPANNGRNSLYTEVVSVIGPNRQSPVVDFDALPSAILVARSELDPWRAVDGKPDFKLSIVTEREGEAPASGVVPKPNHSAKVADAPGPVNNTRTQDWTSFEGISAITGVFTFVFGVIAWLRPRTAAS